MKKLTKNLRPKVSAGFTLWMECAAEPPVASAYYAASGYVARSGIIVMEQIANWVAPIATTIAALLVAANLGARITGIGFIAFSVGSVAWMVIGAATGQANLIWQNAVLLLVNILGMWRWLGLRARYDKGAAAATRKTA